MTYIVTINQTDAAHLEMVKAEMVELGAPTIRCVRDEAQGLLVALEGSHRIAAAIELGIAPILTILDADTMLTCDELGYDDCGWFEGEAVTAEAIREHIARPMGTYQDSPMFDLQDYIEA